MATPQTVRRDPGQLADLSHARLALKTLRLDQRQAIAADGAVRREGKIIGGFFGRKIISENLFWDLFGEKRAGDLRLPIPGGGSPFRTFS